MQKDNIDILLQTCEQEKLHLSGMVQSFGALLVVDEDSQIITHVSENIDEFLDFKADELLGEDFRKILFSWQAFFKILKKQDLKHPFIYRKIKEQNLYLKISKIENSFVIDIQNMKVDADDASNKEDNFKLFITPEVEEHYLVYFEDYMDIVSEVINFDRVMLYEFQDDYSGKVISERVLSDSFGSYLNLMFPASDIPKIARDLYMKNPSRLIADVNSKNIDILTLNKDVPNLTYSDTRSVSPVHIEYLKNMGVKSSFSIPIIISNKLWGLLACHNFSQKDINPISKDIAIEQTKIFALGVQNYKAKEKINSLDSIQYKINDIISSIVNSSNIDEQIINSQNELLDIIKSDGFALIYNDKVLAFGSLPSNEFFYKIEEEVLKSSKQTISFSSIKRELFKEEFYLGPAGFISVKMKFSDTKIIRCYWFRDEHIEELHWAGNPDKPVIEDANSIRLSPRRSFEKFVEVRKGYCSKFDNLDISVALKFLNTFYKYFS